MTTTPLLAFHGDPKIKAKYLTRVRAHRAADQLVQGYGYWRDGKGCAVGCTIHGDSHTTYETELGIPWQIAVIEDDLFEAQPVELARTWPERFLKAIPVGADLSLVGKRWYAWLVRDLLNLPELPEDAARAVRGMADLMDRSLAGDEPSATQWREAESAAWDAWDARHAWAARHAWDAWAAWAARHAWDAWAARAARAARAAWAAWAARAAWAAAFTAARATHAQRFAETLLKFLAAAPVAPVKPKRVAKLTRGRARTTVLT